MDLELSDDQRLLQESVGRLIADRYQFDQRRATAASAEGWSRSQWRVFVDLGLTALPFPEDCGGLGLGGVEMMIVGEAFGRGLVLEPYLASIVLAGTAISLGGSNQQKEIFLKAIIEGSTIAAFADNAALTVRQTAGGWQIDGTAQVVLGGRFADLFVLPTSDAMFLVAADSAGLYRRGYRIHGGGDAADLRLDAVALPATARLDNSGVSTRVIETGIAFIAAEAAGAMQAALDLTVEYLKVREQFGKPIGTNQALQHRAAEMLVEVEQARSAAMFAALLEDEADIETRARGYAAVKAVIGKSARFVGQNAVQLHGGIGVSEEHAISHYFRRLTATGILFGDTGKHVERLAELGGFTRA